MPSEAGSKCRGAVRWLSLVAALTAAVPLPVASQVERWTLERTVVIGDAMDEERGLTRVGSVAIAGDRIYVGQPQESRIRVFTTAGEFVGFVGRPGEGPGEFRGVGRIGVRNDAVWAANRNRVTWFDSVHNDVSSVTVRSQAALGGGRLDLRAAMADGSLLVTKGRSAEEETSGEIRHESVFRLDSQGLLRDTMAVWDFVPSSAEIRGGVRSGWRSYTILPVDDASKWNTPADGTGFVLVHRRSATRPGPHAYQVIRLGVDADTLFARDYSYDPVPIPDSFVEREVNDMFGDGEGGIVGDAGAYRRALREAFSHLDFFPPVEGVHAGSEGTTWLELRIGEEEFEWKVLDRVGDPIGRFRAPEGARLVAGDLDGAWFVEHDELDIPYLVRYDFVRSD